MRHSLFWILALKTRTDNLPETIRFLEDTWKQFMPNRPFEYSFLDDDLGRIYRTEVRLGQISGIFSLMAIFVACLGLFGLASYTAEQRTKEIGIRKVMGATVPNIVLLLSKDFVKLVLLANLIACPIAYSAMEKWLQDFAYRIDLEMWIFVLGGALALLIALLTVATRRLNRPRPIRWMRCDMNDVERNAHYEDAFARLWKLAFFQSFCLYLVWKKAARSYERFDNGV